VSAFLSRRTFLGLLKVAVMSLALFGTGALEAQAQSQTKGKIERLVTSGGIEIWFVRDDTLPILSVNFGFTGGSSQDPANLPGLSYMTAALLDEGAGELNAGAFQQRLESSAITLSFSADRDTFRGSVRVLTDNQDEAFELLRLALTAPRFDQEAIDRIRASIVASLRRDSVTPSEIAGLRWFAKAFPGHPYGKPMKGTLESIPMIERIHLFEYMKRTIARANLKVAAVGSIDPGTLMKLVDRAFDSLPEKPDLLPVAGIEPHSLGDREVVDLNIPQTTITFGGIGLKRNDPDFIPAFVVNHILGGGTFSSRLYREVREKRGLAYSVYSYLAPLSNSGIFLGGTSTRNDRAFDALGIIQEEIARLAKEGPTAEELAQAKSYLTGSYLLHFDTSAKVASQLLEIQLNDLGIDYIYRRNALVEAVSAEDVRRAAQRLLASGRFLVLMVGRPVPPAKSGGG
jgi:zinc protease